MAVPLKELVAAANCFGAVSCTAAEEYCTGVAIACAA